MTYKYNGHTTTEAAKLLQENGENILAEKKRTTVAAMFFSQFKDLMIIILAIATLVSIIMGEGSEAITIIVIVLLNAFMGFIQEYKTEKTLSALKELSAPLAHTLRDGTFLDINSRYLVVDDIIKITPGDKIPADAKILECNSFFCDESIITGESVAVAKQVGETILMGSIASEGNAIARVSTTGMSTEMGKIATMLENTEEEKTPLQIRLAQLGKFVAVACIVICLAVAFIGYLQGENILNMFLTGVSLAVAAIPEGMPAIVTIVLALSVGRILKKGAIIRKLHAVETLGCAGVICSDKTGTITENKMTAKLIYACENIYQISGDGYRAKGNITCDNKIISASSNDILVRIFRCGVLCSTASIGRLDKEYTATGNPTEIALLIAAAKAGQDIDLIRNLAQKIDEIPFDSKRKIMTVKVKGSKGKPVLVKGAPDILLDKCKYIAIANSNREMCSTDRQNILFACRDMAAKALRIIALAEGETEENLTFLGLVGIIDPPRKEVEPAVKQCRRAGIKPVMITGDFEPTAIAIARSVGIYKRGDNVVTGSQLDQLSDGQLAGICMKTSVYARVSPAHKLRIVKAYKACNQVVAMTGDGVNDAPAVKEADIGVAMNSGTDVTKEAAEVVILDNNFATVVSAVEEGRVIYQNIRRFIRYLLTGNLGEVLSMLFSMLLGLPIALVPIQILMMNLLTDGLPAIALGMDPPSSDMMCHKPRPKNEGLFAQGLMRIILLRGLLLAIATVGAYYTVFKMSGDITISRSAAFLTLVLCQMVHIYECRGPKLNLRDNPYLLGSTLISVILVVSSVYIPFLQPVFRTCAVKGIYLVPVLLGIFLGPIVTYLLRKIKHLLFGK